MPRTADTVVYEPTGGLALRTLDVPPPEPGGLLVRVTRAGVCGTEAHILAGEFPAPFAFALGHEGVGVVAECAAPAHDATGQPVAVGDTVYWTPSRPCHRCRRCVRENDPANCENVVRPRPLEPLGAATFSTLARLSPGTSFHKVPEGTPQDAVIAFGCALPTALHGLDRAGGVCPRDDVVVLGAGPVGTATAFAARLAGARRIVVVGGRPARLAAARAFGADAVLSRTTTTCAERAAAVDRLLGTGGRRLVVEAAGSLPAFEESLALLGRDDRLLVMGLWAGSGTVPVDPFRVSRLGLRITGSQLAQPAHYAEAVRIATDHHAAYPMASYVSHRHPLTGAEQAIKGMSGPTALKTVLEPNG
ncbi:zinc-binding dehydrogenase [Streptomyces sp. NPDC003717]|uniref:zinc-binding dehydrogenase n=1 Tax=Streptomyces sp. NPDC003717 TaxID=3154276 RepID=UPI0033BC3373